MSLIFDKNLGMYEINNVEHLAEKIRSISDFESDDYAIESRRQGFFFFYTMNQIFSPSNIE